MALIHAFLTITMRASQIVSGLALTIFAGGLGLSAYFGNELHLAELPATDQFKPLDILGLGDVAFLGPILFDQSALVDLSWLATLLVGLYLARTRLGLTVRAVGEAPASADAMGINVALYRYVHVLVGGAFAGVAGACYSLAIAPGWVAGDVLVNGAGWIAIALVIFAFWRPELCLVGAYLFGGLSALPFALLARQLRDRDPGRARDDLGDVLRGHFRRPLAPLLAILELALARVDLPLDIAGAVVVLGGGRLIALAREPPQVILQRLRLVVRSIALSGRKRSRMYRSDSSAAAMIASSVIRTRWNAS